MLRATQEAAAPNGMANAARAAKLKPGCRFRTEDAATCSPGARHPEARHTAGSRPTALAEEELRATESRDLSRPKSRRRWDELRAGVPRGPPVLVMVGWVIAAPVAKSRPV